VPSHVLLDTKLDGLSLVRRGKVRDVYAAGDHLILVATDRISAFDYVLGSGIPDKGRVLNQLPWRKEGYFDASLPPPASRPTFFAHFGNVIPLLIAFALLIAGIALGQAGRYRQNT